MREPAIDTSPQLLASRGRETAVLRGQWAPATALAFKLLTAGGEGGQRCFVEFSMATHSMTLAIESSTELNEMRPEVRAQFEAILDSARHDVIEDGMPNSINERLPDLLIRHFGTVIPALVAMIEKGLASPIVAAEALKELGRVRDAVSHASRLGALERALASPSPMTRDGAGLGLARLKDPSAIPYLRDSITREPHAELKADLQLVINELLGLSDGAAAKKHQ